MRFSALRTVVFFTVLALFGVALTAWALHPRYLTRKINQRLSQIPGYNGEIELAKLGLLKGTLTIDRFRLEKNEEQAPAAFASVETIVVDFSWRDLLKRHFVFNVQLEKPVTLFLMRQRKPGQARKFALWQPALAKFPPFRINQMAISNGSLRLRNDEDIPPTDLYFDQINVKGTNLANRRQLLLSTHTYVGGTGRMMNEAPLTLEVRAKPFNENSTFELSGKLGRFDLTRLNPVLRHYTGVDIEKGFISVEAQFSASEQNFKGHVRRQCEELDILGKTDGHLGFIQAAKEFIFEGWINRRKDKESGNLEADYELAGPLGYMDQDIFLATVWVAKSAFLQSLRPTLPKIVAMGSPEQAEDEWMELQAKQREKLPTQKNK